MPIRPTRLRATCTSREVEDHTCRWCNTLSASPSSGKNKYTPKRATAPWIPRTLRSLPSAVRKCSAPRKPWKYTCEERPKRTQTPMRIIHERGVLREATVSSCHAYADTHLLLAPAGLGSTNGPGERGFNGCGGVINVMAVQAEACLEAQRVARTEAAWEYSRVCQNCLRVSKTRTTHNLYVKTRHERTRASM